MVESIALFWEFFNVFDFIYHALKRTLKYFRYLNIELHPKEKIMQQWPYHMNQKYKTMAWD